MAGRYASDADLAEVAEALGEEDEAAAASPQDPETPEEEGDEGTSEEEEGVGEEPAAEEQESDEEHSDEPTFTVQIDGQDVEVPQSELIKGYMRTADYTRKTQLLGSQRRQLDEAVQLVQALENNPGATLKVLARHYRVEEFEPDGDEGPSEEQQRLARLEQQMQAELMRQRETAVNTELDRLHREYGEFDEDALFTFAVEREIRDLETALRAMTYGQVAATRRTEKRQMAAVSGGGGRNGAAHPKAPPEKIESFHDAYAAAKRELEMGN